MLTQDDTYFQTAPTVDRSVGTPSKIADGRLQNGFFQHIVWMGVSGYLIINHFEREILMVDPWPSAAKRGRLGARLHWDRQARLVTLANWLRQICGRESRPYTMVGVLCSHDHFDHVGDIGSLFMLLTAEAGTQPPAWEPAHRSSERTVVGPRLGSSDLPRVYGDEATYAAIRTDHAAIENNYELIVDAADGRSFTVSDQFALSSDRPLVAGAPCLPVEVGSFMVHPFIWDHANSARGEAARGARSGSYQRQLAFMVERAGVENAKRTFLIGSAGEMSAQGTGDHVMDVNLRSDLLVQGVPSLIPGAAPILSTRIKDIVDYQKRNFTVGDMILASHWESFWPAVANTKTLNRNRKYRVGRYAEAVRAQISVAEAKKIRTLDRYTFEFDRIPDRTELLFPSARSYLPCG